MLQMIKTNKFAHIQENLRAIFVQPILEDSGGPLRICPGSQLQPRILNRGTRRTRTTDERGLYS